MLVVEEEVLRQVADLREEQVEPEVVVLGEIMFQIVKQLQDHIQQEEVEEVASAEALLQSLLVLAVPES